MIKKSLSLLLAVIMIAMTFTAFPITANAADVDTAGTSDVDPENIYHVSDSQGMSDAANAINNKGAGEYVIELDGNIDNGAGISFKGEGVKVTIIGNGHYFHCPAGQNVQAWYGATVILGDEKSELTLIGGDSGSEPGPVHIFGDDSVCYMNEKVTIKDNKCNNLLGGGVSVQGGTFIMDGGTIDNCGIDGGSVCYGGGVAVYAGGAFTMNGGTISNCYAITDYIEERPLYQNCYAGMGGGVFVSDGSVFTMNGGTITKNTATNFGGGVAMTLSDVETKYNPNTSLNEIDYGNPRSGAAIYGGTVSNNNSKSGAGVFASGLIFAYAHTIAAGILGTGDPFEPGLIIDGGVNKAVEISSNNATDMGGGVLTIGLRATRKAQIHNTQINNNTANIGAGVMNYSYWTQLDIDGCTISDNNATSNGGGILAVGNSSGGYTAIKDTTITDNTSGDRGAGVYYDADSEIRISGADVIQDNEFNGTLNNLNVYSLDKPVKVVGDLIGSQIGLSDPTLWDDGMEDYDAEAVSTLRLTDGYKDNNASLIPADAFTSDHESWVVDYGEIATKTIASEDDFYTYSAQKYTVKSRSDSGESCRGEIYSVKANTFTSGVAENPDVFKQEVLSRFSDTSKYQLEYSDSQWNDYTKLDTGEPVSVYFPNIYNAYIYINPNSNYSNPRLITSTGHQTQYAESGTFVYQYYTANSDTIEYSDEFETIEFHYDELLDSDMIIYDYDEFGHIISQTVVNKTPVKTPHQETIIELRYDKEVRLVRKKPDYHINNTDIDDHYNNNDIFTSYVETATKEIKVGETIDEFYTIPEVVPTKQDSCPYIFKGWYYDPENDNDSHPVDFGTDKYAKDIYAHWIKVENVAKDEKDTYAPPKNYHGIYGGFDLPGVQIRKEMCDYNFDNVPKTPGGLRFITSLNMDVVKQINAIKANNIEYGYVAATHEQWIEYHSKAPNGAEKLQYVSKTANGIDTSSANASNENYYGFAKNVNCTSKVANRQNGVVNLDHQNFDQYLLYSLVITYEGEDAAGKDTNVLARPYIKYTDANGLERVAYSDYRGTNVIGGCYTNYNAIAEMAGI